MTAKVTIPNTFATATTAIPLSQLDGNFSNVNAAINNALTFSNYALDTGTANNYAITITGQTTTYAAGIAFQFKAANANSGASTLNVNGQGTQSIVRTDGTALSAGDIAAGAIVSVMYDGTNFQLLNDSGGKSETVSNLTVTGTATINVANVTTFNPTITNAQLANSTATLGNATITLGGTTTTVGNLTLQNANITSVSPAFPNSFLANSSVTLGNTAVSLGSTATSLGNLTTANVTITNFTESVVAVGNTGASQTLALTNGTVQTATLTANCTVTMPTAVAGKSFLLFLNTGAGSLTCTFTSVKWSGNTAPTVTTTASKVDVFTFVSDGTSWYGTTVQNF